MAEDYTPTMARLRDEYVQMRAEHYGFSDLYGAEWDRALATHDQQERAQALRDAAENLPPLRDMPPRIGPVERCRAWLNARADSLAPRPAAPGVSVSAEQVGDALREHGPIGRAWYFHQQRPVPMGWVREFLAALGVTVTDGGA